MEKKRILIVDDDSTIVRTLQEILKMEGYEVDTAETGEAAVKKFNTKFYNLALLDIRLPDMDGTELLTAIKETTPQMVKIMITGYPSMQNAIEAVNKGADGYIVKPVDMEELLSKVREHLKKQEEEKKFNQEKMKEYIESRAKEIEASDSEN